MKLQDILAHTRGIPFIDERKRAELYEFVLKEHPKRVLELGFAHGVSACVIAGALDELGEGGELDTVDILPAKAWQDKLISIEQLSDRMGLSRYIRVYREHKSYTWWLKKQIEHRQRDLSCSTGLYDFIFIDGAHNWTIDSCAFFLCEKLLRQGGWMLFDDLTYTYRSMVELDGRVATAGVSHYDMSPDEISAPHVGLIFELLVRQHERFGEFRYSQSGDWGWAKKTGEAAAKVSKLVVQRPAYSLIDDLREFKLIIRNRIQLMSNRRRE